MTEANGDYPERPQLVEFEIDPIRRLRPQAFDAERLWGGYFVTCVPEPADLARRALFNSRGHTFLRKEDPYLQRKQSVMIRQPSLQAVQEAPEMLERQAKASKSHTIALALYDRWVRARQSRPMIRSTDSTKELAEVARENFRTQLVEPRRNQLSDMAKVKDSMAFADQAALLAMMELPVLETSTLLHRLGRQVAEDPEAKYFSKVNLADNCGCGCGCGCAAMANLGYQEKIVLHYQTKPYSIDPFNELETPAAVRDSLLVKDFLESFGALSGSIAERVNSRYYQMGRVFSAVE